MGTTYLDHASAAPWHPSALAAADRVARSVPGDPSRRHTPGREARDLLESARGAVAGELGGAPERCVFTSGGTEAAHLAVRGALAANRLRPKRVISSAVEHSGVLAAADATGAEHIRVGVDEDGAVDLDELDAALAGGAALVNLQHANHEVGTRQPVAEAAARCRDADALVHVDACQTAGRVPVDLEALGADMVSVSGAKFGGGRGVGALVWSPRARLATLVGGDEREHRRRAGLQSLPAVAAAAETLLALAPREPDGQAAVEARRCDELRRRLRGHLDGVDDVVVHGAAEGAAPHVVAASALYVEGEALLTELDAAGFAVHSGSSCASTAGKPSHVLTAMGALTHGHVRASVGPAVAESEIDRFADAFADAVDRLRTRVAR
jgi:cysteine desulfurase